MGGSLLKNLKYFEELCENEFKKIIFITTMWDQTDKGEKYERELKESYWRPILDMGSSTRRFLYERSSAFDVLSPYFDEINRKSFRRLQDEVQDVALKLHRLMDGKSLSVELERAISCRQKTLQRIRAELRKPSLNEIEIRELMDSYEKEFEKLSRVATELKTLGIETGKHFKRVVWRMNWDEVIGFVCLFFFLVIYLMVTSVFILPREQALKFRWWYKRRESRWRLRGLSWNFSQLVPMP